MLDATPPVTTRQVSVAEAARELGISPETVRRWIKSGRLEARRAIRPQGTVWEVNLPVTTPRGVPPVIAVTGHSEASLSETGQAPPGEAEAAGDPEVEAGQVVHLRGGGVARVHPPVAAAGEGDEAGLVERLGTDGHGAPPCPMGRGGAARPVPPAA